MEADKRFAHISNDPKFRRIPKGERKVKIDERFQSMFKDKQFQVKYTVDKRGRPVNHSTTEDLKRYYELDSEEDEVDKDTVSVDSDGEANDTCAEEQQSCKETNKFDEQKKKANVGKSSNNVIDPIKKKLKNLTVDYARGEGNLFSAESSSDDDDETNDNIEVGHEEDIDHKWGELDADAECTEVVTSRLAACNMDWDRIRATDLMVLFNSFLPPGGSISSVVIYPSEFGKKRLAEEEIKGPAELIQQSNEDKDEGNEEGGKYHMEKLRQYQLNRLKYYYAVVTCDSSSSANKIYTECDGMEYESSATKIDLRFIPADMEFDDKYKELCDQLPELAKYKPRFFTTTALQQAKVDLTWDETNPDRVEIAERVANGKIDDITDSDLQVYLASSSGEESETEDAPTLDNSDEAVESRGRKQKTIDKYKLLLQEIEEKEKVKEKKDIGMEFTWGIDLQNKTEQILKEKKAAAENKTPFEHFLDKRKEKRKEKREAKKTAQNHDDQSSDAPSDVDMNDPYFAEEFSTPEFKQNKQTSKAIKDDLNLDSESESDSAGRRAELELMLDDESDKKHFSLKKIQDAENETKSKNKRKNMKTKDVDANAQDDFHVNVNDERFSALFTSHHYNIDPTDPHYKKTKNMEKLISEKIKRRTEVEGHEATRHKKQKPNKESGRIKTSAELNVLVKSVKRKAEAFKRKSSSN